MRFAPFFALLFALLGACDPSSTTDAGSDVPATPDVPSAPDDAPPADAGPDTWASWAQGFFATYCVECHAGPPSGRDYRTIADVRRDAAIIRCGTTPRTEPLGGCGGTPAAGMFPVGGGPFPSDEERRRLVAWIDGGLLE
jgi:hypothetical protein